MTAATERHKVVARHIRLAFQCEAWSIARHWDADDRSSVFVLKADAVPRLGVVSFSTVGLSDRPMILRGREFETRVELAGACVSESAEVYAKVMATLAFCVMNTGWFCAPGVIFPDVVKMYSASETMADVYFVPPYLWNGRLHSLDGDLFSTAWLMAVPISKAEATFAQSEGSVAFEKLLEQRRVDVFDLNRASVV